MRIAIGLVVCAVIGCAKGSGGPPVGDDDGGGDDAGVVTGALVIEPAMTDLLIMNGVAARASFTATLKRSDGTSRDVTGETRFGINGDYGSFAGNVLSIGVAGRAQVVGVYGEAQGTANVTARLKSTRVEGSLPPAVVALFEGTENPALAPQIVYPPADTVMPRNLGDFEIHWTDAHQNDVFEVALRTELSDVRVYVRGGNGLPALGPTPSWSAFRADEWIAAVGMQGAVVYQVRGARMAAPGMIGAAAARTVQLSSQTMDGGLYYWASATAASAIGVFRHDMANPGQPAEEFLTTSKTGGRCIACHVLSRDGSRMAITYQDSPSPPGPATMVDVPTGAVAPQTQRWNFGTFTPDNQQFLSVDHGTLVVRDATTQAVLATMTTTPANAWVTHPDLSPDGKKLVYVRPGLSGTDLDFKQGQLYTRSYDAATRAFGPEQPLINDGTNNYYPSWSPDGAWVLFNRGDFGSAYDNINGAVWVVRADGGQPPVELAAANASAGITNAWVRWAPFSQTLGPTNEPIFWITMSSKRDFGVRLKNAGLAQFARRAQLWMSPFYPARAAQNRDPSVPAFRLPFQNFESSNHIAQWTERVLVIE